MDSKVVAKNLGGVFVSGVVLDGFAKIAIMGNEGLDMETIKILCRHIDDLRALIGIQDDTIATLKNQKNP